jgi:hypothetical protein
MHLHFVVSATRRKVPSLEICTPLAKVRPLTTTLVDLVVGSYLSNRPVASPSNKIKTWLLNEKKITLINMLTKRVVDIDCINRRKRKTANLRSYLVLVSVKKIEPLLW